MDYVSLYTDFLKKHAGIKRPSSIVCDSSNGATGPILEKLLPQLGLKKFSILNNEPDPEFPAHGPNPLLAGALDQLSARVTQEKADFGAVFDADGDRVFFVDETGTALPSFVISALLFRHEKPPFVADELTYQALRHMELFGEEELFPSRVGSFFIKQKMKDISAAVGGEFSGHFYFKDFFGADSGIFAMIRALSILSQGNQTLSEFAKSLPKHAVKNEDISIAGKNLEEIKKKILAEYSARGENIETREGITLQSPAGWTNIRPSNTEPILRFYAGAESESSAQKLLEEIKAFV